MNSSKMIFLFFALILLSCSNVDRSKIPSFGEELIKLNLKRDTNAIKKFVSDTTPISFSEFKEYYDTYEGANFEFVKFDTTVFDDSKYFDLYYKIENSFHRLEAMYFRNNKNEIVLENIWLDNLNSECEKYLSKPYIPSKFALNVGNIRWTMSNNRIKRLSIVIQNVDVINNYKNVKFKILIFKDNLEVVNRTINVPDIIYSRDTYEFEINELKGNYISNGLNSDNCRFEIEFISSDHPINDKCEDLDKIKLFYKN